MNDIKTSSVDHEQFRRQRRNLIIISSAIFLLHYLDLKFEQINILGNTAKINNQAGIEGLLWLMFIYWLIRYTQYLLTIEVRFSNEFKTRLIFLLKKRYTLPANINNPPTHIVKMMLSGEPPHSLKEAANQITSRVPRVEIEIKRLKIRVKLRYLLTPAVVDDKHNKETETSYMESLVLYFRSALYLTLNTTLFSEYILPYVLAAITIGYAVLKI